MFKTVLFCIFVLFSISFVSAELNVGFDDVLPKVEVSSAEDDYALLSGNNVFTGNNHFTGNTTIDNLTYYNVTVINSINSSDWWDDLDTPADINAGDITDDGTYLTSESDPQVGTLTSGKWCTSDGSQVNCQSDEPAGGNGTSSTAYVQFYSSFSSHIIENMSFVTETHLIDYVTIAGNEYIRGVTYG